MSPVTLKSLHAYLKLLENAAELKRKMPSPSNQRSMKEGWSEMGKLMGVDAVSLQDPQSIAASIGQQRFVTIWGEPSISGHVARIFESAKLLFTVLIDQGHVDRQAAPSPGSSSAPAPQYASGRPLSATGAHSNAQSSPASAQSAPGRDVPLDSLKPLLEGNAALASRLFRVLFEHLLCSASQSSARQGGGTLINELAGSKEHGRAFLASAMFVLGTEVDRENLMPFLLAQGLYGMPILEQLLQNREYCDAYYNFRKLERAFPAPPDEEELRLTTRIDALNAQFGGKPCGMKLFEGNNPDKATGDAHLAAADLLEALALTSWSLSLNNAVAIDSSNSVRSIKIIARHFEGFARGTETKEHADQEIADHLLAFAGQFSADSKST
jgi:hypothetical protein